MGNELINTSQLARRWGIATKTLQNWRGMRKGPPFLKIGGRILYSQADIEHYEANNYHRFNQ
ncbi:MAG: helix-turn-helix domain-containing protein [Magnetococcales bacterium]|nr:helix-turn-helix domain-containing protein [Magnetococcales bacterium]MBF0583745.1 helix-turn-helix domain-containing protein [Magnetococcales bacterium]